VSRRPQLQYTGTYEQGNPFDPASPPITATLAARTTFTDVGAAWALYSTESTVTMGGVPQAATSTGVTGGAGFVWWDPAALAAMTAGQVLDTDPVTGQTVTATAAGTGTGGPTVTIVSALRGVTFESVYDVTTGVMLSNTISTESSGITTRASLQQMP
jgi:hypothetical protein